MKMMMKTFVAGAAMLIAAAQATPAMAQESSYKPGTVWNAGRIDVLPGQFENYMDCSPPAGRRFRSWARLKALSWTIMFLRPTTPVPANPT